MGKYRDWFGQYVRLGKITAEEMRKYYLANLNCLDDNIGRVLDALDELKLTKNTVVIFFSDNGGPPTTGAWNRPLAGSKFTLWEGGIRVPFILARPGDPARGTVCDRPISTLDIFPTCLQAAGIEPPGELDGLPIPGDVTTINSQRSLFWRWKQHYAVRFGDWKLLDKAHRSPREPCKGIASRPEFVGKACLFNLKDDPSESRNLLEQNPEVVQRLQQLYAEWSKEVGGPRTGRVSTTPDAPKKKRRKKK
jgi:arylsulfatase A-like enzyme